MANYNDLITAIDSVIKTNNRREITGQLLQNVLNTMVGSLGENYQLAGFATPTTNPHQPDQNVFYVASQAGVYTQFDNIVLGDGISFLMWKNGAWTSQTISIVTQSWIQQNYVSKEWFRKVFRVYDEDGLEIVPNDMDSVVDNIKAMVGLWTNEYLSALGMGRDGGGSTQTLAQLNDVQLSTLENGDALVYNTAIHKWENKQIQTGVDMSVVWAALAANTNEQINASHLATALSSYVTSANLSTMLNDYATKSWAGQNFITIEWFDKLFQLYNGTEAEANKIAPNGALPVDQTQLNIEAMFGFWTKKYISALGQGDDGSAGSGDVTWELLASQATDGRTIHLSYISAALASYLSANNYLQSSAIADMATQTWVGQQGFLTSSTLTADDIPSIPKSKISDFPTSWAWSAITGKPTTVSGYGITDAITTANIGSQSVSYAASAGSATSAGSASSANVAYKVYCTSHPDTWYLDINYDESTYFWLTGKYGSNELPCAVSYASSAGITGTLSATSLINGTASELPHLIWHIPNTNWGNLSMDGGGNFFFRSTNSTSAGYANLYANLPDYLAKTGGTITGATVFSCTNDVEASYYNSPALCIGGTSTQQHIEIDGNEIMSKSNTSTASTLYLNAEGGTVCINEVAGNCGIGTGNPSYKLDVSGSIGCSNLYSSGAVSALSDIRHKEIVRNTNLQVEQIAAMRSVIYRKKDSNDDTLYAGSIAQDWQSILPQVVSVADNDEHTQSLQYGVAALIAVITTARKVAEHERRIADLERENERLKEIINNLNVA